MFEENTTHIDERKEDLYHTSPTENLVVNSFYQTHTPRNNYTSMDIDYDNLYNDYFIINTQASKPADYPFASFQQVNGKYRAGTCEIMNNPNQSSGSEIVRLMSDQFSKLQSAIGAQRLRKLDNMQARLLLRTFGALDLGTKVDIHKMYKFMEG